MEITRGTPVPVPVPNYNSGLNTYGNNNLEIVPVPNIENTGKGSVTCSYGGEIVTNSGTERGLDRKIFWIRIWNRIRNIKKKNGKKKKKKKGEGTKKKKKKNK